MSGFSIPNHTQTPNTLFDDLMREMTEAELKVTLAVIRKTLGYHKQRDPISWSQIMDITGLSRAATQRGIDLALERGLIEIVGQGLRGVNIFGLVLISDQSELETGSGLQKRPHQVSKVNTQKKSSKEKKEKVAPPAHTYIEVWARIRGFAALDIGAPVHTGKDTACAKRMAKWSIPPTEDEIRACISNSKSQDYAFQWLEKDIPSLRVAKATKPVTPTNPAHVPFEFVDEPDAIEMPPEAREAFETLMKQMNQSDEALYGNRKLTTAA